MEKVLEELKQINELMVVQQVALGPQAQRFAEGQCKQFMHKIKIVTGITPALATSFTSLVHQGLWTADQKQALVQAVNERLLGSMESGESSCKRRPNQKLYNFTAYLRQEDINALQAPDVHVVTKLAQLCELCWKLSLTMPDEPTFKHLVATTLAASGSHTLDGPTTYGYVQEFKTMIRSSSKLKHLPPQPFHLEQYPTLPKDLPQALYDHVYEASPPIGIALGNLAAVSSAVVLRKSSRALNPLGQAMPTSQMPMSWPTPGNGPITPQMVQSFMYMQMMGQGMNRLQQPLTLYAPRRTRSAIALQDGTVVNDIDDPDNMPPKQPGLSTADDVPSSTIVAPQREAHVSHTGTSIPAAQTPPPLFELPSTLLPGGKTSWSAADQAANLAAAMDGRSAANAKAKGKAKAKAKGKVTAKAKAKGKAKANSSASTTGKRNASSEARPSYPKQQGGGAVYYNGGKVLRSDTLSAWRVFIRSGDRCDKKVPWKGSVAKSWQAALDMIDSA